MKNSTNDGFDQHDNAQAAVDQDSLLIVATALSNHPNDQREVEPTLDALAPQLGQPPAAALDNGYFSDANVHALETRGIEPYIATGREPHHLRWRAFFAREAQPAPPPESASLKEKMAYKLRTDIGQAIYRLRKCTVEPVIGIIKEVLGFRQFSLRRLALFQMHSGRPANARMTIEQALALCRAEGDTAGEMDALVMPEAHESFASALALASERRLSHLEAHA